LLTHVYVGNGVLDADARHSVPLTPAGAA
jgi:hypothetical protein